MPTIELTALETILGGYGPVDSGTVSATYWAGNEPYLSVVGDEVRFPSEIKVQVVDGATVPLDMVPTRGVCCVRWVVRDHRSGHRLTRYTTIPDVPAIDFGDLVDVDPATFAPSAEGLAAWLAAIADVQAAATAAGVARDESVSARTDAQIAAVSADGSSISAALSATEAAGSASVAAGHAADAGMAASGAAAAKVDAETARDESVAAAERAEDAVVEATEQLPSQVNTEVALRVPPAVDSAISSADIPGQVAIALAAQAGKIVQGVGMPNGVVTAPVGTLYVDTASTMGASVWRKATGTGASGWVVIDGDTGWRDISGLLVAGLEKSSNLGSALIKRRNDTVYGILKLDVSATGVSRIASLPAGFRGPKDYKYDASVFTASTQGAGASALTRTHTGVLYPGMATFVWQTGTSTPWPNPGTVAWSPEHLTADAWPTSLPGTAA